MMLMAGDRNYFGRWNVPHAGNGEKGSLFPVTELLTEERVGETLIVTPTADLRELAYQSLETGAGRFLSVFSAPAVKNVVVDFHRTDYFGSTALAFLVRLWKRVTERR